MKITLQKVDGGFIITDGEKSVIARKYDLYKKIMQMFGVDESKPYPKTDKNDQSSVKKLKKMPK